VRFLFLPLSKYMTWCRIMNLLFDNLVSDLQIFLLAKTVLGGGWRATAGDLSLVSAWSSLLD
jgi:hypothetical protein